jgi:SAM-dependent methyltransferase
MSQPRQGMPSTAGSTFDRYAEDYQEALQRGVGLSGEDSSYFAARRVEWLGSRLRELGFQAHRLLDFGCGTGSTTPFLLGLPGAAELLGTDVSDGLLATARRDHGSKQVEFAPLGEPPDALIDLAYCNGVFHHIPPSERAEAVSYVWRALRPGGLFAFWENNPWNPGTRLVMRRIPFDRDALTLSAPEARELLEAGGFEILRTEFLFVFPRALAPLRRIEPAVARLPLGAQYLVLAAKPEDV